ncbi:hypothetical protein ERJ75_000870300 [Trypanosoma vivax]|nr:hypothetical protein ERJ75_000870300 [Trypanosoma vivax]
MSFSIRRFPTTGSRVDHSLEGWSIIEKITDFTHAVCRASNGKGSAILIALPRQPRQQFVFLESVDGQPGPGPRQKAQQMEEEQIGVLLTTSFVLPSKEEGQRTTMTFLEQPVVGSDARYGYVVEPFEVAVRSDKVFVCSTGRAVSGEVMSYTSQGATPARESSSARESNRGPYSTGDMSDLHQEALNGDYAEEEIGYSFTLCDMRPLYQPPLAKHRSHSFSAVNQKQRCLPSDTRNAPSPSMGTVLPPLQKLTSTQAARYGETCHASAEASRTGVRVYRGPRLEGTARRQSNADDCPSNPCPCPCYFHVSHQ